MRNFDTIIPNHSVHYLSTTLNSFQTNLPMTEEKGKKDDNEDFMISLQKGFKDISSIYRNCYNKPSISFQCNYYCNLNSDSNNDDSLYATNNNRTIQSINLLTNSIINQHTTD